MQIDVNEFISALEREDKIFCFDWAIDKLQSGVVDVLSLYSNVLTPALNSHAICENDDFPCIWKEHVRTGIVRAIIEAAFGFVLKERNKLGWKNNDKTVLVLCPPKETHEIGARMVADFFTIFGYNTVFVGSDTPVKSFLSAIEIHRPRYVAISTTNPYNVFHLQKTIEQIRAAGKHGDLKIIVGGNAFKEKPDLYKTIGADMYLGILDLYELAKKDAGV